jgi:hypothetical protein
MGMMFSGKSAIGSCAPAGCNAQPLGRRNPWLVGPAYREGSCARGATTASAPQVKTVDIPMNNHRHRRVMGRASRTVEPRLDEPP